MIKVHHPNGYYGILYGKSSLAVYEEEHGYEMFHTGFRNVNTEQELYSFLENVPKILKEFAEMMEHDLLYGKDGEQHGTD